MSLFLNNRDTQSPSLFGRMLSAAFSVALAVSLAAPSVHAQMGADSAPETAPPSYCWGQGLSPAAGAVSGALQAGRLSQLGTCNHFNAGVSLPQDDWLHVIQTPAEMNQYRTAIRDLLIKTRSTFSHSRLEKDDPMLDMLSSGLCELHNSFSDSERFAKPIVRFHFSNPGGDVEANTREAWHRLISPQVANGCLPVDTSRWNFHLAVRTAKSVVLNNKWNHGKVTISDENRAISGSVETSNPELAIALSGDAAAATQDFYEAVWATQHRSQFCLNTQASLCSRRKKWTVPVAATSPPSTLRGTNVFSLGRNFPLWVSGDDSADHAIYAALEAAEESLFISQAAFASNHASGIVNELVNSVAEAAASGADVRIALGNEFLIPTDTQAERIYTQAAWMIGILTPDWTDYYMSMCRLHIADHPNSPNDSHAKSFEVDRTLFYAGSQNFYPSGIGNDGPAELSEHGFLVDGYGFSKNLADRYHSEYAVPTWNAAAADGMLENEDIRCDQVFYPTRLQGSASNGYTCDISLDTEFDFDKIDMDELASFQGEGVCTVGGYTLDISISGEIPITGIPAHYGEVQNGVISGSIRGTTISDSAALLGTFTVDSGYSNLLDLTFDGLELGVTYSGSVTRD